MSHVLAIVVNTGASSRRPCQAWSPCCQPVFNCYRSARGKITSQFGNSILLNFRQVVKGIGLSISALFPDSSLRKQLFIFYRSAVSGQPGCLASGNGRYYTPPTILVKGFHDQFPILVRVCLTYPGFFPGTSLTVAPSFLKTTLRYTKLR